MGVGSTELTLLKGTMGRGARLHAGDIVHQRKRQKELMLL